MTRSAPRRCALRRSGKSGEADGAGTRLQRRLGSNRVLKRRFRHQLWLSFRFGFIFRFKFALWFRFFFCVDHLQLDFFLGFHRGFFVDFLAGFQIDDCAIVLDLVGQLQNLFFGFRFGCRLFWRGFGFCHLFRRSLCGAFFFPTVTARSTRRWP